MWFGEEGREKRSKVYLETCLYLIVPLRGRYVRVWCVAV